LRKRASLIIRLGRQEERIPCLILDGSRDGFKIRGVRLSRGQIVEIIPEGDPLDAVRCRVVWAGKPGSGHDGELGLQTANKEN
jgi:hypothetical protein